MNFLDSITSPISALFGSTAGWFLDPVGSALNASNQLIHSLLLPKPPGLGSAPGAEQVYEISGQQNTAQIDDPQGVMCGTTRYWPPLCAQPWNEYIANDQVLHQRMRIGVGINFPLDLRVGDADANNYPGLAVEVCLPGQPLTIFHPNVYTAPEATGIDIATGALKTMTFTGGFTFGGTGHVGRIDHDGGDNVFGGNLPIGSPIIVSDDDAGGIYKGTYSLIDVNAHDELVDVDAAFTAGTANATVTWQNYDTNQNNLKQSTAVALNFSNTLSTISCSPTEANPNDLSVFAIGDEITPVNDTALTNQNVTFTVVGSLGDGSLIVTPPPSDLTGIISDIVLLRRWHGPFNACPQGATVNQVGIDIVFPQGLVYNGTDGNAYSAAVTFEAQWRPVDDLGIPQADWTSFGLLTYRDSKRTPQRRTKNYTLDTPCRAQVRLARVYGDPNDSFRQDAAQWTGLKGFIVPLAGENDAVDVDSTTLAVTLHASGVLAQGSDKKINCLIQAWKQIWNAETGWSNEQPTNNPIWADLDLLRGPYTAKGVVVPDDQIDLVAAAALAADFDAEGIEFNGCFDTETTLLDARQTVLRVGRAAPTFDWVANKFSYRRDVQKGPVQMFTDLNSSGISNMQLTLRGENDPTGVQISYQDPIAWEERTVTIGDVDTKPQKTDFRNGCTDRQLAWAECNYEWNSLRFRNRSCSLTAEMEPITLKFGDPLLVQCRARQWGQGAEIHAVSGRTLTVWPVPDWSLPGQYYVYLRDPNGVPGSKINCSRGASDAQIVLAADPDVEITGDANGEQPTLLALGVPGNDPVIALAMNVSWSILDQGGQQATIQLVLDDDEMYADPGEAPPDPYAVSGTVPAIDVTGLDATASGSTVSASWDTIGNVVLYELQWQFVGQFVWNAVSRGLATSASFTIPSAGTINVRVRAYGYGGSISDWSQKPVSVGGGGGSLTVFASPTYIYKAIPRSGGSGISAQSSGFVTGGTPPYTPLWEVVTPNSYISIASPSSLSSGGDASGIPIGDSEALVMRLKITDAAAAVAYGPNVTIEMENTYSGGGGIPP